MIKELELHKIMIWNFSLQMFATDQIEAITVKLVNKSETFLWNILINLSVEMVNPIRSIFTCATG